MRATVHFVDGTERVLTITTEGAEQKIREAMVKNHNAIVADNAIIRTEHIVWVEIG